MGWRVRGNTDPTTCCTLSSLFVKISESHQIFCIKEVMSDPSRGNGRPASAQSRTAWGADGGIDNLAGPRPDSRQSYGDPDMPAAMESDLYDPSLRADQPVVQVHEPNNGCWHKFSHGIRCEYIRNGFRVISCTRKFALEKTRPHFKSCIYDSEGEKSLYRVKNIKRMGKTMNEFTITKFPSKKKFFGQL